MANLQVVVANQQAVLAKVQMFCGEFAMRLCSSVVGGSEVSDATTWTIVDADDGSYVVSFVADVLSLVTGI